MARSSAVAIIETPHEFVLEGRPDIEGALAYAGKTQLFGGGINDGEAAGDAIRRELREELNLQLPDEPPLVRAAEEDSRDSKGNAVRRHVSLFHVVIASTDKLNLQLPETTLVTIPKTVEALEINREQLTKYAFMALYKHVTGELWED